MTLICADVLDGLATLEDQSVQCCVTSPPYWGLRDYGTATWDGGRADCDHLDLRGSTRGGPNSTITGGQDLAPHAGQFRNVCSKCGAKRIDKQLGLESTPEEYVARMVGVFDEVRRVLRDDGTLWLNLGDSYASTTKGCGWWSAKQDSNQGSRHATGIAFRHGLKVKDLVGIPWRVAFALQAAGWYLRSDIIWAKPNPMPESVTDRPTKSHEYVFLMAKSARYFFDSDAVREATSRPDLLGSKRNIGPQDKTGGNEGSMVGNLRNDNDRTGVDYCNPLGRNVRTVWTITTQPFPDAHFAVMPKALVEKCVKAGSAEGDTVLDPFAGSGTVGIVAERLGRKFVGIDLNPEYVGMAQARIDKQRCIGMPKGWKP